MLSNLYRLPVFRGREFLMRNIDRCLGPRVRSGRFGVNVSTYLASTQDASFFRSEDHNPVLEEAIKSLPRDGVFIDCGSNCGFYSAFAATRLGAEGMVVSLEPSYREYLRLTSAVGANPHVCQWLTLNTAAGTEPGVLRIDTYVGHTGMNRMTDGSNSAGQTCAVLAVDDVAKLFLAGRDSIDLIKIDVEGFEMQVLLGMGEVLSTRRIRKLVVEVTDRFLQQAGSSKKELYEYLGQFGYKPQIQSNEWQYDQLFI